MLTQPGLSTADPSKTIVVPALPLSISNSTLVNFQTDTSESMSNSNLEPYFHLIDHMIFSKNSPVTTLSLIRVLSDTNFSEFSKSSSPQLLSNELTNEHVARKVLEEYIRYHHLKKTDHSQDPSEAFQNTPCINPYYMVSYKNADAGIEEECLQDITNPGCLPYGKSRGITEGWTLTNFRPHLSFTRVMHKDELTTMEENPQFLVTSRSLIGICPTRLSEDNQKWILCWNADYQSTYSHINLDSQEKVVDLEDQKVNFQEIDELVIKEFQSQEQQSQKSRKSVEQTEASSSIILASIETTKTIQRSILSESRQQVQSTMSKADFHQQLFKPIPSKRAKTSANKKACALINISPCRDDNGKRINKFDKLKDEPMNVAEPVEQTTNEQSIDKALTSKTCQTPNNILNSNLLLEAMMDDDGDEDYTMLIEDNDNVPPSIVHDQINQTALESNVTNQPKTETKSTTSASTIPTKYLMINTGTTAAGKPKTTITKKAFLVNKKKIGKDISDEKQMGLHNFLKVEDSDNEEH